MEIRPIHPADLSLLSEIDGTLDSTHYLHVERSGEGSAQSWATQQRPLRERLARSNPLDDEAWFWIKQIATGADEGLALLVEHDGMPAALLAASPDFVNKTLRLRELRVDFDCRRQGLATALLYQAIAHAREGGQRAVAAETVADNFPAASLLMRCGFELSGLDTRRRTNHDLVKEAVALFWYAPLD